MDAPRPDISILIAWLQGRSLCSDDRQALEHFLLRDYARANAFGITADTVATAVQTRLDLLRQVYPDWRQTCCDRLGWHLLELDAHLESLWTLWLPLAMQLAEVRQSLGRPLIQGILGGQGTGKTTLAILLRLILGQMGYSVASLSIDDLYKTYADRQRIQSRDPRLKWRGPPGTHDVDLGLQVLRQLRQGDPQIPVALPRFDKSLWQGAGDRVSPEWVTGIDIVLFEGWFIGVRPVDPAVFDQAPEPIISPSDRQFARDINHALADYLPLWDWLDRLMVLRPVDYRLSQLWRRQAEQRMRASGRSGMSDAEVEEFVVYFWRSLHPELFITPLCQDPSHTNLVIEISADHAPIRVYAPPGSPSSPQNAP